MANSTATAALTTRSGRSPISRPAAAAMAICVVRADAAPIQTASGRRKRADSTIVASIVLSGSSATNTVANAATTAARSTTSQSNRVCAPVIGPAAAGAQTRGRASAGPTSRPTLRTNPPAGISRRWTAAGAEGRGRDGGDTPSVPSRSCPRRPPNAGRSSRSSPSRRRRRGSPPPRARPHLRTGWGSAPIGDRCGGATGGRAASPTTPWSTTSTWRGGARAPAAPCRASTPWRC